MTDMDSILPVQDAVSSVWFDAAKNGTLLLQYDPANGKFQFYPRAHVVGAPDREPEWVESSGAATLYSFTVVKRSIHPQFAGSVPFTLAIVELAEGPRMTSWIVDVAEEELRCDMHLKVVFHEIHPGLIMPCFTKA
ncbi:Zn-ribbon domain-containing OB-fold protein [Mesorhizobium muleiense]|uniref:Zn-ribbon domain-containing OB-fold protein n=1 Tax=Mesorhizobium muleiense TaxID=1004279 RepID=UPI001F1F5A74|nr:OB-fold domain-containing protein [Mesorhizobium muleiense]MCF6110418.1 OB-fold domain-containing protein [Mesorhizobium muleiense]